MISTALIAALALGQMQMDHGSMTPQQATLRPGLGDVHHRVSTKNLLAQRFFDQGLALTYGFNHHASIAAFQEAARLDPNLAMAHWGIAYAMGPNYNLPIDPATNKLAYAEAMQAVGLENHASPAEKALIDAIAQRYTNSDTPDFDKQNQAYATAMAAVAKQYPKDADVQTLYAESLMDLRPWRLWNADGTPAEGTNEIISSLKQALKINPNHIGANHYLIHALEASNHPELALDAAHRLEHLAPQSGHLVHMPSHIYIRTGDWEKGVQSNDAALKTDTRFLANTPNPGPYPMYYVHNFDMYRAAANMEGNYQRAQWAAQNVAEKAATMGPMGEPFVAVPLLNQIRFRKWDAIKTAAPPSSSLPVVQGFYQLARGLAAAKAGDAPGAEAARDALKEQAAKLTPADAWGLAPASQPIGVSVNLLEAAISRAKGDGQGEIEWLKKAVEAEDQMGYDEPPDYFYPVRESLGGAYLRAGNALEAEAVFREDLKRNPNNGRSLFGVWKALEIKHDPQAGAAKRAFEKSWSHADTALTVEDL